MYVTCFLLSVNSHAGKDAQGWWVPSVYGLKAAGASLNSPMPASPVDSCLVPVPLSLQPPALVASSQPGEGTSHIPAPACSYVLPLLSSKMWSVASPGAAGQTWGLQMLWEGLEGEEGNLKGLAGECRQQTAVAACLCSGGLLGNGDLWTATQNLRERSGKTGSCMHFTLCGRERPTFSTGESCRLQWPWGNAAINVQTQPVKIFSDLYLQNWLIINSSQN